MKKAKKAETLRQDYIKSLRIVSEELRREIQESNRMYMRLNDLGIRVELELAKLIDTEPPLPF